MSEARWDQGAAILAAPGLGVERAELSHVEEFGKRVSRLTVWLAEPARLLLVPVDGGLDLGEIDAAAASRATPLEQCGRDGEGHVAGGERVGDGVGRAVGLPVGPAGQVIEDIWNTTELKNANSRP